MSKLLGKLMAANERVLLVSPPGMGKTARVAKLAKENNRRLVTVRASLSERIDFGGCLVPDVAAGVTRALPLEVLQDLRTTKTPTILFLDDLGQAPLDTQAACMLLFDEGVLSPEVLIWGATNRPGDKAGVTALCEPLRSRFHLAFAIATPGVENDRTDGATILGTWKDEVDGWVEWALDIGASPEVVAWHRSTNGRTLYAWKPSADPAIRLPDFRSWATVTRLWAAGIRDLTTIGAAIGKPAAAEFLAFARLADKLPSPDEVWISPSTATVPADPSALYLVATMLAANASDKVASQFCEYIARLPRIYTALAATDAFRRVKNLSGNKHWCRWWKENEELFVAASN